MWLTANAVRYIICRLLRGPGQPGILRHFGLGIEDSAAFLLAHRVHDPRAFVILLGRTDIDRLGQVFFGFFARARKKHERAAHLELIAAIEQVLFDPLAIDVGAVGTVQVGDGKSVVLAANLGVMTGDFGVVQLDVVRGLRPMRIIGPSNSNRVP